MNGVTMNIYDMKDGNVGIVQSVNADSTIRQRLFDMGILPKSRVFKERTALLGDPVWIKVDNIEIALRRNEAEAITINLE